VQDAAPVARRNVEGAGFAFEERDQFGQGVHAERGRDADPKRLFADKADRHEVAHQVDRKVLLKLGQCNEI